MMSIIPPLPPPPPKTRQQIHKEKIIKKAGEAYLNKKITRIQFETIIKNAR